MGDLQRAKAVYSTGFFLLTNAPALLEVGKYANDNDVPFVFNLSAVFIMDIALDNVLATLKHADIVFANEDECDKFGKATGMENPTRRDVAKALASYEKHTQKPRIAIVTQGPAPVIVCYKGEDGEFVTYEVQ